MNHRKLFSSYTSELAVNPFSMHIDFLSTYYPYHTSRPKKDDVETQPSPKNKINKNRILIIEDDIELTNSLNLMRFENQWPMQFAKNSLEALTLIGGQPFDVLVLDWNLPDCNGDLLLELSDLLFDDHMRKHDYQIYHKTPVITFSCEKSSHTKIDHSKYFYRADHWSKPLKFEKIKSKMEQLVYASVDRNPIGVEG